MAAIRTITRTMAAAAAIAAALALVITARPAPQAATVRLSAAQWHFRACDWRVFHRIDRYTSWRYVSPRLAREYHVGACSKAITGTDGSVIFSQRGYVISAS